MPISFVAGPNPVKASDILNISVKFDMIGDQQSNRAVVTAGNDKTASVTVDKANSWDLSAVVSGQSGIALRNVVVGAAQANTAALAALGSNAPEHMKFNDVYIQDPKKGNWYIAIDRAGTKSDQVLRGNFADQLPQSIKDVLVAAADVVAGTLHEYNYVQRLFNEK